MAWLAGVVDVLVLGEADGEASDAEADPVGDAEGESEAVGESVGAVSEGGALITGGVVAQADSSTSAVKPPRARNEMAMPQR